VRHELREERFVAPRIRSQDDAVNVQLLKPSYGLSDSSSFLSVAC
jgi:hypothetical protein